MQSYILDPVIISGANPGGPAGLVLPKIEYLKL